MGRYDNRISPEEARAISLLVLAFDRMEMRFNEVKKVRGRIRLVTPPLLASTTTGHTGRYGHAFLASTIRGIFSPYTLPICSGMRTSSIKQDGRFGTASIGGIIIWFGYYRSVPNQPVRYRLVVTLKPDDKTVPDLWEYLCRE